MKYATCKHGVRASSICSACVAQRLIEELAKKNPRLRAMEVVPLCPGCFHPEAQCRCNKDPTQ